MTTGPPASTAEPPVDLIFDTDIGNDIDDVLALGMIHALQSRGDCNLLAVVRPGRGYFGMSEPGRVIVDDDGGTRFEPAADGLHCYLTVDATQIARGVEALANLCSQPVLPKKPLP